MDPRTPLVLEGINLPDFVQYILKTHAAPSTLIICSTKEVFLQQLHHSHATNADHDRDNGSPTRQQWTTPTLRLLVSSRTVKLAFCPELAHLRAYLAAHTHREQNDSIPTRTLAILNPINVHKPTSAFSAQGLNRTLAVAVEAAHHTNSRLVLAEVPLAVTHEDLPDLPDFPMEEEGVHGAATRPLASSPWDEEVSILNVTTKSFGTGERGWVGRTVKVRAVVGRWCVFRDVTANAE